MVMDPPGGRDERRRQAERLRREEAYYHFINELSEEEYRLMRDSNLLGTPGEVTAEELRQRLDGAKERVSSQPRPEPRLQNPEAGEEESSSGAAEPGTETSNGDSLLEWLNTFRRTGNATRSGQSGNQTWRAVSRTNPNSGEFRFSLEININHEQPEPGEHSEASDPTELPLPPSSTASASIRTAPYTPPPRPSPYTPPRITPYPSARPTLSRRAQTRRTRSSTTPPVTAPPLSTPVALVTPAPRRGVALHLPSTPPVVPPSPHNPSSLSLPQPPRAAVAEGQEEAAASPDCPRVALQAGGSLGPLAGREPRSSRTRSRGRIRRATAGGGASSRSSRRSRSPLQRSPAPSVALPPSGGGGSSSSNAHTAEPGHGTPSVPIATTEAAAEPAPLTEPVPEAGEQEGESHAAGGAGTGVRRHPTIMLDLQVRRIRPGENRDRDSIASRTRSRARAAENTVTFESDSGGFRRTISRSERAGIRTYVSTIRIPLRRISETGLGEPSSTALRSILRQIMTGFGELSSLMETEADSESAAPAHPDPNGPSVTATAQAYRIHSNEGMLGHVGAAGAEPVREGLAGTVEEEGQARLGGGVANPNEGRPTSRDTNNLVENGTLPILRLAHFFLLNDEEDEDHPRGLTKEQIDNLATRTYGQASLEGELGRACSVCINEYAQGNKLRRLPCAHEFHIHCIDRWLSENNTCPICRQPILAVHQD
ncbi:E3 ubiquitin-protein ligase RNF6 [Hypomesus transpacificus]|uniref:E3 ubiquitin-protein ligase RNF6 n=1 Tax=Hypomesus transpacificus TaxID=137520 RepID=UPI001F07E21E|nr:E3 ubiquitin-protein ligase RNF6 [Hypomesus transpacificus]XP_046879504.1 E3 ubiquitin-protein ligase RNF6 [Hypomesus transpacificus]